MNIHFAENESYRPPFSFKNSRESIARFPFPFKSDAFAYTTNLEPHEPGLGIYEHLLDIDEHYIGELKERRLMLAESPGQHYVSLPHSIAAQWDFLELVMESYSADYPNLFSLKRDGTNWTWENKPLHIVDTFTFGDSKSLAYEPLEYIGRQTQGELILLEERDGNLIWIAGMTTSRAAYSLNFNLGMNFTELHGPVPVAHEAGVFERALKFLVRLKQGHPFRRTNWNLTVFPRHDISAEATPRWAHDWASVTPKNVGDAVYLRIEGQSIFRLPRTNALAFPVRTYFASLRDIATNPAWAKRLHRVVKSCPKDIADYKGFTSYQALVVDWLAKYDDGKD